MQQGAEERKGLSGLNGRAHLPAELRMAEHAEESKPTPEQQSPAHRFARITYHWARRIVVAVVGSTILLIGLILLVTPGPAFAVIPIGLAILALEFAWARHWLKRFRGMAKQVINGARGNDQPSREVRKN